MSKQINILIADDNNQVRKGLELQLSRIGQFEIVGLAVNGRQAIDLLASTNAAVVLMDVGMPVMDGIEACQIIKRQFETVKVIMLTSHDSQTDVLAALAAGADGYCLKETNLDHLANAINAVAAGNLWFDGQIADIVSSMARAIRPQNHDSEKTFESLSQRELEVLNLVVSGLGNQAIADELGIGLETVKTHVRHIMEKLAVDDRTQMAVKALRKGLVK